MSAKVKVSLIPNDFTMDFEAVCKLCQEEGVQYLELAYMWDKSILELSEIELNKTHDLMDKYNLKAASIQTQIMKVFPPGSKLSSQGSKNIHRDFDYNIAQIDTAISRAKEFKCDYIVTYSFYKYLSKVGEENWQKMFKVYDDFLPKLKAANKTVVVECEGDTYIDTIASYIRFFKRWESPHIRANFDLANLHSKQPKFNREDFDAFYPYVPYFHVKDRVMKKFLGLLRSKGAVFGQGNIPWRQVLSWFAEKNFSGVLSVEPHVHGPDRFELGRQCVKGLQSLLKELNIPFE